MIFTDCKSNIETCVSILINIMLILNYIETIQTNIHEKKNY